MPGHCHWCDTNIAWVRRRHPLEWILFRREGSCMGNVVSAPRGSALGNRRFIVPAPTERNQRAKSIEMAAWRQPSPPSPPNGFAALQQPLVGHAHLIPLVKRGAALGRVAEHPEPLQTFPMNPQVLQPEAHRGRIGGVGAEGWGFPKLRTSIMAASPCQDPVGHSAAIRS